jgi:antitoxin MazE
MTYLLTFMRKIEITTAFKRDFKRKSKRPHRSILDTVLKKIIEDLYRLPINTKSRHLLTHSVMTYKLVSTLQRDAQMTATFTVNQTIQEWGNGLAVRITAPVAKAARFTRGLPITVEVVEGGVFLRTAGKPKLTLAQKLKAFNPAIHGGEVMATGRVGAEVF